MNLKVKLTKILSIFAITVAILLFPINVLSVSASTEGMLISSDNSTLKIYPQPNQELPEIATASVGEKVTVLEKVYNNDAQIWDRIRLIDGAKIEGWISDGYVVVEEKENSNESNDPYDPSNYYQINQVNYDD